MMLVLRKNKIIWLGFKRILKYEKFIQNRR